MNKQMYVTDTIKNMTKSWYSDQLMSKMFLEIWRTSFCLYADLFATCGFFKKKKEEKKNVDQWTNLPLKKSGLEE